MNIIYNGRPKTYMTEISESDVWYVCGWLRSFIRDTEGSVRELSMRELTKTDADEGLG
jgi:hypothetical protein